MAGSPKEEIKTTEPRILNVLVNMENNNKSPYTIETTRKALNKFAKFSDINDPESIKQFIARLKATNGYKRILCNSYQAFCQYYKIQWEKPKYTTQSKNFKVPTTEKINQIIAASSYELSLKLQISKECGLRPVEVITLTAEMINTDNKTITPITAKHGLSRTLPISENLNNALRTFIQEKNTQPKEQLFKITAHSFSHIYRMTRNRVAKNLNDPTIKQIRLYDFRHYFGTKTYQKHKA